VVSRQDLVRGYDLKVGPTKWILTLRSSLPLDVEKGEKPPPSLSEGEGVGGVDKYRKGEED